MAIEHFGGREQQVQSAEAGGQLERREGGRRRWSCVTRSVLGGTLPFPW